MLRKGDNEPDKVLGYEAGFEGHPDLFDVAWRAQHLNQVIPALG